MRQGRGVNMNSKPRVDIIGSCVSRDVFNSRFNDVYKEHVEIGQTVYQTALPSIVERSMIPDINDTDNSKTIFKKTLDEEFSGNSIDRIIVSRPDFIVMDFFADVHFGVTRKMGRYITRNHMAFQTLDDADVFYDDHESTSPERMRFDNDEYKTISVKSLCGLRDQLRSELPKVEFVVNSARFSSTYMNSDEEIVQFDNRDRIQWKNDNWAALDEVAIDSLNAQQISHGEESLIATPSHPWGLHPVHYIQPYYDSLWRSIRTIIKD